MGSFSIWHWIVVFVSISLLVLPPVAMVLRKTGRSRLWCILVLVPLLNLVALWVFAYIRWPALDEYGT